MPLLTVRANSKEYAAWKKFAKGSGTLSDAVRHAMRGAMNTDSFYRTMIDSPEFRKWEKLQREKMEWDIAESIECGRISPEHLSAFFSFIKTL